MKGPQKRFWIKLVLLKIQGLTEQMAKKGLNSNGATQQFTFVGTETRPLAQETIC